MLRNRLIALFNYRVNFKKNEKIYNAANSEVLKMVQEIDSEPKEPEPGKKEQTFLIIL
jgi:hypothetical protein